MDVLHHVAAIMTYYLCPTCYCFDCRCQPIDDEGTEQPS